MKVRTLSVICLLTCLVVAAPTLAQRGPAQADPLTGTWSGDWGTTRTVKMEAEAKNTRTNANIKYLIDGKLDGNTLSGSWNHDSTKGDFKLTKK